MFVFRALPPPETPLKCINFDETLSDTLELGPIPVCKKSKKTTVWVRISVNDPPPPPPKSKINNRLAHARFARCTRPRGSLDAVGDWTPCVTECLKTR